MVRKSRSFTALVIPSDMDTPRVYEFRLEGHLAERWSIWFDGLAIHNDPCGEAILTGLVTDQSALFGVLSRIHDLNLILISVHRLEAEECG